MKRLVFTLAITAMAAGSQAAGDDRFAFLQCGVQLGGKYLSDKPTSEKTSSKMTRMDYVAGIRKIEPPGLSPTGAGTASLPFAVPDTAHAVEFRLPPKVTVASVGCSWL